MNIRQGQIWRLGENNDYILAQVDRYRFALIGLYDGNRWADPVECALKADKCISAKDFKEICDYEEFIFVKESEYFEGD